MHTEYQDTQEHKKIVRSIQIGILVGIPLIFGGLEIFDKIVNWAGGPDGFRALISGH